EGTGLGDWRVRLTTRRSAAARSTWNKRGHAGVPGEHTTISRRSDEPRTARIRQQPDPADRFARDEAARNLARPAGGDDHCRGAGSSVGQDTGTDRFGSDAGPQRRRTRRPDQARVLDTDPPQGGPD